MYSPSWSRAASAVAGRRAGLRSNTFTLGTSEDRVEGYVSDTIVTGTLRRVGAVRRAYFALIARTYLNQPASGRMPSRRNCCT